MKLKELLIENIEKNKVISFSDELKKKYGIQLWLLPKGENNISVEKIVVPEDKRNEGIGTKVMKDIINFAKENGLTVSLTPSKDFGGNINKLNKFYKSLGFKKNTDYSISDKLIYG